MGLLADIRYAARSLGRQPGLLLALMLTLALGIGSKAAVFGFMNGLVSRRTPLAGEAGTAISLFARAEDGGLELLSYRQYLAIEEQTSTFDALAAVLETRDTILVEENPIAALIAIATPHARSLFALPPGEGVIISERFFQRAFAGRPNAAEQHVILGGTLHPIGGVAPATTEGLYIGRPVDIWVLTDEISSFLGDRESQTLTVIGRLRTGVPLGAAREALEGLPGPTLVVRQHTGVAPEMLEGMTRLARLMPAVAGAVFLIACANVALFLLSRGASRSRDTSLRLALGATRGALARAVFVESALIAIAGGAAGSILAIWTADVIPALLFVSDMDDLRYVPDIGSLIAAASLSTLITIGCGMLPLIENRHDRPAAVLQREPRRPSKPLASLRRVLVVFQLAACCALVISAASLGDALERALRTSAGERLGRPILATVESQYEFRRPDLGTEYFRRIEQAVRELPDVRSVAWMGTLPGAASSWYAVRIEPATLPTREVTASAGLFTPDSLARVVLPPTRGRMFGGGDTPQTCRVVVLTESTAARLFDGDPVGRVMVDESGQRVEVVGVVTPKATAVPGTARDEPAIYYYAGQGSLSFERNSLAAFHVPQYPNAGAVLDARVVSSDYFELMGISLRSGTLFAESPPPEFCRVGVVNERAAQQYFDGNAVGASVIDARGRRTTIVGVVEDVRLRTIARNAEPSLYLPMWQEFLPRMHMILGSADASIGLQDSIRRRLHAVDGGKPDAIAVVSLDDHLRSTALAPERIATLLLTVGAFNALTIGLLGLYRVIADDVLFRRHEIAVRSALGAQRWRSIAMVVSQGTRVAAAGGLFGIAGAVLLARWMRSATGFHSGPGWEWLIGPIVLLVGAFVASALPAHRILRVSPIAAMRIE